MEVIEAILWIVFTLVCIIVSGVILLQEGKGGGLGEAFGGAGQQTFGVKAQGIAKFTGLMGGLLVVLALVISKLRGEGGSVVPDMVLPTVLGEPPDATAPAEPGSAAPQDTGSAAPVDTGSAAPAGETGTPATGTGGTETGDGK